MNFLRRNMRKETGSPQPVYVGTFPNVKSKDVFCGFCRHKFYIGRELKGFNSPLLLPCGHTTCSVCELKQPERACPECPEYTGKRTRLPYNLYIIGLIQTINHSPQQGLNDPDMTFHMPVNNVVRQNSQQGFCQVCGMVAKYFCKTDEGLFCKTCLKRVHGKGLENHEVVPLNQNGFEVPTFEHCPNHKEMFSDYYCYDCAFECCSHCIIKDHKECKTEAQSNMNSDIMPQFYAAYEKLQETRSYTYHTLKNLSKKVSHPELAKQSLEVENRITQHFIYLHGILQNLEQQMKDQLTKQRSKLQADVDDIRNTLTEQLEKMTAVANIAEIAAESPNAKTNIRKFTEKLLELANSPCHLIPSDNEDQKIRMEFDESALDSLKRHARLHVPDAPRFNLVGPDQLPENYVPEPLPVDESINSSFRMSSRKDFSTSCMSSRLSSQSRTPSSSPSPDASFEIGGENIEKPDLVRVSHIIDPTNFYVQKMSAMTILRDVEDDIAKYMSTNPPEPSDIDLNKIYIVQSLSDLKWHRGRVRAPETASDVGDSYLVFFIDYGFSECGVTRDRIRNALPGFTLYPGQALHCTFGEIASATEEWDYDTVGQFRNMVIGYDLTMKVLRSTDYTYTVDLYRSINDNKDMSVRDWLIDVRIAKPVSFFKLQRMNPLSTQQFYYEDLTLDQYTRVRVLNVESPNCIYLAKGKDKEIQEMLNLFHSQFEEYIKMSDQTIKNLEYGMAVAIKQNNKWHRGIVSKIFGEKVEIFLIDHGISRRVLAAQLLRLTQRFCSWNAQAIKFSMVDIKPLDREDWPAEVIQYVKKNLQGKTVKAIPFAKVGNRYDGVITFSISMTNFNAHLVSKNYAESTGKHSKHSNLNKDIGTPKKQRQKRVVRDPPIPVLEFPVEKAKPKKKSSKVSDQEDAYTIRVVIGKIESPDAIYVADTAGLEDFQEMDAALQHFYESNQARDWDQMLRHNCNYVVYSRKDKRYCRAQFVSMVDEGLARMDLVDLAELEDVPLENIRPLYPGFANQAKRLFKVKLAGIQPPGGSKVWPSSSCQKLKDIISDTGDAKYYITSMESTDKTETLVDLKIRRNVVAGPTEPIRKENICVARRMVEEGLALPIRDYSLKIGRELAIELKKKLQLENSMMSSIHEEGQESDTVVEGESSPEGMGSDTESARSRKSKLSDDPEEKLLLEVSSESTPLPPKLSSWIEPAHLAETTFDATTTYVDFDCNVHFHPETKDYINTLKLINETLDKRYSNRSIKKYDLHWEEGDLCIANYHYDKKWYRGKVVQVVNHQILKVHFVDYGNTEECQVGSVKKRIILSEIPIQCIKASIVGLKPAGRFWRELDLDIIHSTIVSKLCKMKVVSKPPNPWAVAIWLYEGSSLCPLPWFLKTQTQVRCEIEQIHMHYNNEITETPEKPIGLTNGYDNPTPPPVVFAVNGDVSLSDSSDEEFLSPNGFSGLSEIGQVSENEDESIEKTLRGEEDFAAEVTMRLNNALSDSMKRINDLIGNHSSEKSLRSCNGVESLICNGDSDIEFHERILCGSMSFFKRDQEVLEDEFDTLSVHSESLYGDKMPDPYSSTPFNKSFEEETTIRQIDFSRYNFRNIEVTIAQVFSPTLLSGYITKTPDENLNGWISKAQQLQEEIQAEAENQPKFVLGSGEYCIAEFDDGLWYRAKVIKPVYTIDGDGVVVEFVDFGDRTTIFEPDALRCLKQEWMDVPCMGFQFHLHNVRIVPRYIKKINIAMNNLLGRQPNYYAIIKNYTPLELELYYDKDYKELVYAPLIEKQLLEIIDSEVD